MQNRRERQLETFFEEYCLDAERSINSGSWLCASGSSFFNHNFVSYCPVEEAKRLDGHGTLIRKYVPALRDFPEKYIHEPWTAPYDIQEKANCTIGADYPDRMLDHIEAKQRCVEKLRKFHKELVHP
ncbi:cryptochrome-1-like isoform X1, partial [Paramuricea clavata]